jgi:hypothetical protein
MDALTKIRLRAEADAMPGKYQAAFDLFIGHNRAAIEIDAVATRHLEFLRREAAATRAL